MIGIQALTGLNPRQLSEDSQTGEIMWQHLVQVSDGLATVLNKMVRHYFKYRYQSATEALQALQQLVNPNTPQALAAVLSQRVRNSYQSAIRSLQMLQYRSATKALRAIEPLAKPQISPDQATTTGPQSLNPTPSPINSGQNTVTVAPVNRSQSPVSPQSSQGSVPKSRRNLPLLIGAGTATVVIAVGAIYASRQPQPTPATTQNKTEIKTAQDKTEPKNNCVVVVSSSNVRSDSGRRRTGEVVKAGTKVSVTGKQEGGWIEISSPVSGWIWKSRTKNTCPSS
jgi:serine/threonine-protein kinase